MFRIGLHLLSMLACRPSELREARWSEFDLDSALWTIPAERMKRLRTPCAPAPPSRGVAYRPAQSHWRLSAVVPWPQRLHQAPQQHRISNGPAPPRLRRSPNRPRFPSHRLNDPQRARFRRKPHRGAAIARQGRRGWDLQQSSVLGVWPRTTMMQWYADHQDTLAKGNVVSIKRA